MKELKNIAVIILNWNGAALLERFLPTVIRFSDRAISEVIVADNGSSDGSLELLKTEFPDVRVIAFPENLGFAGGYNAAIEQVDSEYVLLLNSDVEVGENWLGPLYEKISEDGTIAAVQPKILALNDRNRFEYAGACGGFMDKYGYPFCRGRIMNDTEKDVGQYDAETDVFWCSGAALLVRRDVYRAVGGLDENFFAHMEEIDLCWRIRNRGFRTLVCPSSKVWHLGGGTLPMNHPRKLMLNYRNNFLMLYKNLPRNEFRTLMSVRIFMDFASACIFLLKGELGNMKAVFSAYRSFMSMRPQYSHSDVPLNRECIYPASIVMAYFLKGHRKFLDLHYKLISNFFVKETNRGK